VACLGYSRAGAGALVFSKEKPDLLAGIRRCLWHFGGLAQTLVWDRQAGIHAHDGRPSEEFAAFCGQLLYSLDPDLVGQRVELRVSDREILGVVLDTGELACRHPRSFARHRTITALEHARALKRRRGADVDREPTVQIRSLDRYDALIA
jgi:hypothetical protein